MSDLLLQLSQNRLARSLIKTSRLPVPLPQALRRAEGPWEERPLSELAVATGAVVGSELGTQLSEILTTAGASLHAHERADALVFDATGLSDPGGLRAVYDFFHAGVRQLNPSGRVVVIARPPGEARNAAEAAARRATHGFVKSLGREVGRKGATTNLVEVASGAEDRIEPVLRFLLSARSAFVSGQVVPVTARVARQEPRWVRPLEGKVALVTGAARGIGEATARLLAAEGAHVIVLDREQDSEAATKLARELNGSALLVDVSAVDAPSRIAAELARRHPGVDIVVHNAGITRDKTLARMDAEQWDQTIDINLSAVMRITAELLTRKLMREGGRIICLSSIAGIAGNMGQTNYSASKAGIIGFVEHEARALASHGITVNAVAPGLIETRLTAAIPTLIREVARRFSNLGQGGMPEDVGQAIVFLASPGASGLTGNVLRVCGGAWVGA